MQEYVSSALTAAYKRPGDGRDEEQRYEDLVFNGREGILAELYCSAADLLPHVRTIVKRHPELQPTLVSVGVSPYWLLECLKCFEPAWSTLAFDFTFLFDAKAQLSIQPSDVQIQNYESELRAKIPTNLPRHYIIFDCSANGRTAPSLRCFSGMLSNFCKRYCASSIELSAVQLVLEEMPEDSKVSNLVLQEPAAEQSPAAVNGDERPPVHWTSLAAPTIMGLCGCVAGPMATHVPKGTRYYPPTLWGKPVTADYDDAACEEFAGALSNMGPIGACETSRLLGNTLFGAAEYEAAAASYVNARLLLEKVLALSPSFGESRKGEEEGESSVPERIRSCRLSCATNAAFCHLKCLKFDECVNACNEALSFDPNNAKALFRKGTALHMKDELDSAERVLRKAVSISPKDKAIRQELEKVIQDRKQHDKEQEDIMKKMFE
eukprot:TRINITY_DN61336_c0_g1_i1.p1 TRINITY_DN61336_c0_g1~~TRINITY_DN61336_c0_g1_i1.p1  ORF type:complete len:436 (+),score=65.55 TRINITY_DN61336_c0_g1_i1:69-1376(+)